MATKPFTNYKGNAFCELYIKAYSAIITIKVVELKFFIYLCKTIAIDGVPRKERMEMGGENN
ncbi:hypothetical protein [Prevotella pallens]|uniref:hypothetical protein n=1 Tax=Prevotella pallens TaxID=60133 RepID=UPI001CB0EB72|nr:hypothetical protein [Prevotella pallens]MBF1484978.1 hypothetical protein [Prevotella pallens]MBF1493381.1 hypothetical protein [Prevotella pallens]MBF1505171.1 hypothetical protein [Prevotella pallens]